MEITTSPTKRRVRHPFRRTVLAGAAVPTLIAGEFAMMAIVPVAIATVTTWRDPGLRKLRPWAAGLATLYTVPLLMWAVGPDRAPSLSKDMHPAIAVVVSLAGAVFAVRAYRLKQETLGD
ncbi:hypothetical protein [Nocardioides sp. CER19]|uniref:hypothetical protein n=1 Tax=Nocardioides sp. CER19 TaxID=3038538 RepID=UPI00244AE8C8|nr:hypothetical protein [Nocardioides sp. CER19]MDH2412842.1 hypothetical protein [Nocardioides sp. CER19]